MAASDLIKMTAEPMLAIYSPPTFKMGFSKLFLGHTAPHIEGIRFQTSQKGLIIFDLDFKWGGDPRIILQVKSLLTGIALPIQVKDVRYFATIRVLLKLSEDIPCIAGAAIATLAQPQPELQYNLKAMGGSLTSVPGISDVIRDTVNSMLVDMLQWPHRLVIPIARPPVDLSDLELKLQGRLTLTIVRAQSLRNLEMVGKVDPYVRAYIRERFKVKTRTIPNNLHPEWNETFELNVEDQETQVLVLKVLDKDVGADTLIGVAAVPLASLKPEMTTELSVKLKPSLDVVNIRDKEDCGSLKILVTYHVFTKEEQAAAMEAERDFLEAEKKARATGIIGEAFDAMQGALEDGGKVVAGGVELVGSGLGSVGSSIGSAGKFAYQQATGLPRNSRRSKSL